jgi:hypothetical protein
MSEVPHLPGYRWFRAFKHAPVRLGVYIGVCLSLVFTAWIIVANRLPLLDPLALERNLAAAVLLILLALIPILRFIRSPWSLLLSGVVCWTILSFVYRILCLFFTALNDWHSTTQVFMLGLIVYLLAAALSWVGGFIWRARESKSPRWHNPFG